MRLCMNVDATIDGSTYAGWTKKPEVVDPYLIDDTSRPGKSGNEVLKSTLARLVGDKGYGSRGIATISMRRQDQDESKLRTRSQSSIDKSRERTAPEVLIEHPD